MFDSVEDCYVDTGSKETVERKRPEVGGENGGRFERNQGEIGRSGCCIRGWGDAHDGQTVPWGSGAGGSSESRR